MEELPHLRVVGSDERPRPRRPGPAVLSILLYALIFGGALWYLRSKGLVTRKPAPSGQVKPVAFDIASPRPRVPASPRPIPPSRDALLSGAAVPQPVRDAYFQRLATDRCDCGCGRTLSDCLANEKSCSRSPALASRVRESVNGKPETILK